MIDRQTEVEESSKNEKGNPEEKAPLQLLELANVSGWFTLRQLVDLSPKQIQDRYPVLTDPLIEEVGKLGIRVRVFHNKVSFVVFDEPEDPEKSVEAKQWTNNLNLLLSYSKPIEADLLKAATVEALNTLNKDFTGSLRPEVWRRMLVDHIRQQQLEKEADLNKEQNPTWVIMYDLARLHDINSEHGDEIGNEVLEKIAEQLRGFHSGAIIARRGDEFYCYIVSENQPELMQNFDFESTKKVDTTFVVELYGQASKVERSSLSPENEGLLKQRYPDDGAQEKHYIDILIQQIENGVNLEKNKTKLAKIEGFMAKIDEINGGSPEEKSKLCASLKSEIFSLGDALRVPKQFTELSMSYANACSDTAENTP